MFHLSSTFSYILAYRIIYTCSSRSGVHRTWTHFTVTCRLSEFVIHTDVVARACIIPYMYTTEYTLPLCKLHSTYTRM